MPSEDPEQFSAADQVSDGQIRELPQSKAGKQRAGASGDAGVTERKATSRLYSGGSDRKESGPIE